MGAAADVITRRSFVRTAAWLCAAGALGALGGCSSGAGGAAAVSSAAASGEAAAGGAPASSAGAASNSGESSSASADATASTSSIPKSAQEHEQISTTVFAFDTVVTLTASCSQETLDSLAQRCEYFESIFSRTIPTSDIGRVNAAGGKPVEVAPETADIIAKALTYCEASQGLFDITIGAVSTLGDFKEGVVPDAADVAEGVKHVDYTNVQLDGQTVTLKDPKAKLDLGGIAKGYIADDLCKMLEEAGCDSGFVNLGGNVKTVGVKPDGKPWHVGIQDPNDVQGTVVAAVYAQPDGTSVVTSGLYERQFTKAGTKYWHILDPKTGYPVKTDLVSATIISSASIDGDGYTKPLFMMGHDEALAWINAKDGIEGMVVSADGTITQSNGCGAELL